MEYTDRELLEKIHSEIKAINSAFAKNEDGEPDYQAHRLVHRKQVEQLELDKQKSREIYTNVITWAVIGLISLVLTIVFQNWPLLPLILGKYFYEKVPEYQ